MKPLVSVLMPCYNSARTLPMALASLIGQTYEDWECVLVDDGSTDSPEEIVAAASDRRIRFIRLPKNRGRGVARQMTLDRAQGDFIAMLDADDWYYPEKLARQVEVMLCHPDLALLSTGMAILDRDAELVGVRLLGADPTASLVRAPWTKLAAPPLCSAPSMIRAAVAKQHQFRPDFSEAEDVDFLLRVLQRCRWGVLGEALYTYREHASVSPDKVRANLVTLRRMFLGYRGQFPVASRVNVLKSAAKSGAYRVLASAGLWHWAIARRSRKPTATERASFAAARKEVEAVTASVFTSLSLKLGNMR
jgi:glycosyltransferase involved in cell wall biosynthesis